MAKLEPSIFLLNNGQEIIFRNISPEDAQSFLNFRKQIPHESTHTMQYVGMKLPSLAETAKRLALQQDDKIIGIAQHKL